MKVLEIGTKLKSKNMTVKVSKTQPFISDVFSNKEEDIIYEVSFGEEDVAQNSILLRDYELFYTWKVDK